ncbi:MAG: phosphoribosylamine--glycine ligase [Alphaproteobacteria bacterium]|nr:phosphoribosylamine--glycine ligase [Alphaproteobacteria bacterium]
MKVLLIGSGGREHALAWALSTSEKCEILYCAPGNAGIEDCAKCVDIAADDLDSLTRFAQEKAIDLVIVGPEAPLVAGLADKLKALNIAVFGPDAKAAQLEGSKGFMKDLCAKYDIPTAAYGRFADFDKARDFIEKQPGPVVVKADGLAAGKGVVICNNKQEAIEAARDMLSGNAFGSAGAEVIIEEFLDGEELSYFALADGKTLLPLNSAQDHKRAFDGDKGPNTGGMGAYSPAHLMTPALEQKILSRIIEPTLKAMEQENCPFTGVLFAGIMVVKGEPILLEYNTRFGDPECQTLMMRLQGDLLEILSAAADGKLSRITPSIGWSDKTALCVVMAANGYPGAYKKQTPIDGLKAANALDDIKIFHAGTAHGENGQYLSTGGRVLGITALGATVAEAQSKAYNAVDQIHWPEGFCRRDIGGRATQARKTG